MSTKSDSDLKSIFGSTRPAQSKTKSESVHSTSSEGESDGGQDVTSNGVEKEKREKREKKEKKEKRQKKKAKDS